jgi:hypothetical protein
MLRVIVFIFACNVMYINDCQCMTTDGLIDKYGIGSIEDYIRQKRGGAITIYIGGRYKDVYGNQSSDFINADTIARDLEIIGSSPDDLHKILSSRQAESKRRAEEQRLTAEAEEKALIAALEEAQRLAKEKEAEIEEQRRAEAKRKEEIRAAEAEMARSALEKAKQQQIIKNVIIYIAIICLVAFVLLDSRKKIAAALKYNDNFLRNYVAIREFSIKHKRYTILAAIAVCGCVILLIYYIIITSPPRTLLNAKISSIPKYVYSEEARVKVLDATLREVYDALVKFDKKWVKLSEDRWALKTKTLLKENDQEIKISYCFVYEKQTNSSFLYEVYIDGEKQDTLDLGKWADELDNQAKLHAFYSK